MKTIQLPDHLADKLIATGKELAVQDNLGTMFPIWYVSDIIRVQTTKEYSYDVRQRVDVDQFAEDAVCESCYAIQESDGYVPEDCDNWRCEDTFSYYKEKRDYASYGSCFFLTQKACQKYIDENSYHFSDPKPYAGSAFRNDEIQPIIQALILVAGEQVPSNHYGYVKSDSSSDD